MATYRNFKCAGQISAKYPYGSRLEVVVGETSYFAAYDAER